jgi:nitrogen fixation/metabolism regulation signal transduction histidine kinase
MGVDGSARPVTLFIVAAVYPFMLAVLLLIIAASTITATWKEQTVSDLVERSNGQCGTR